MLKLLTLMFYSFTLYCMDQGAQQFRDQSLQTLLSVQLSHLSEEKRNQIAEQLKIENPQTVHWYIHKTQKPIYLETEVETESFIEEKYPIFISGRAHGQLRNLPLYILTTQLKKLVVVGEYDISIGQYLKLASVAQEISQSGYFIFHKKKGRALISSSIWKTCLNEDEKKIYLYKKSDSEYLSGF